MRILFILTKPFCPEYFSGPNRSILELCQKLTDLGHEAIVLAGQARSGGREGIVTDPSFGFRLFRATHPRNSIVPLCMSLRPEISVLVDDGMEPGMIETCQSIAMPLAIWFQRPVPTSYGERLGDPDILHLASSEFSATRLEKFFGLKAKLLLPYIEAGNYHKARRGNRVLFVNPLREKGVELAFRLASLRPKQAFNFVESGKITSQWRRSCFERAMGCGNIEWFAATNDMNGIFEQTRLLLLPRIAEEGFCRLISEAQLGGIPVLAADRGNVVSNVGAGGKVLTVDSDIEEWLDAFDRFFEDEPYCQNVSERAQGHALRNELNGDAVVARLLELLVSHIKRMKKRRFSMGRG